MPEAVAVITGASRGLGTHIAKALADAGHPVVLAARSGPLIEEIARQITDDGGLSVAVRADITVADDRERIVKAAGSLGPIGVLVNNAAVGPIFNFHEHSAGDVAEVIDVNLAAPIELTRLVVAEMIATGGGRVVNVATVAAKLPMPYMVLYSVTKAGLTQFSAALDLEYRDRNIRATTVLPGAISDEGMAARAVEETGVEIPNDGAVRPEVVAKAVLDATRGRRAEVFVGAGSRFMAHHPRLAYRLIRKSGVFESLSNAADRYRELERAPA